MANNELDNDRFRPLVVKVDGNEIAKYLRVRARGRSNMTLLPDLFIVDIYNLPDEEMSTLRSGATMTVSLKDDKGVLCYGAIEDTFIHQVEANIITTVVLIDGKAFSKARVSMTIAAGTSVRSTMVTILGSGLLGPFLAPDTRLICAQTFSGRTADYVSTLAKAVNARAFYTHDAVIVTAKGQAEEYLELPDDDVIDEPSYAEGVVIVRTKMRGYSVGTIVTYKKVPYRVVSFACDVDNKEGMWRSELTFVDESSLDSYGMEGG